MTAGCSTAALATPRGARARSWCWPCGPAAVGSWRRRRGRRAGRFRRTWRWKSWKWGAGSRGEAWGWWVLEGSWFLMVFDGFLEIASAYLHLAKRVGWAYQPIPERLCSHFNLDNLESHHPPDTFDRRLKYQVPGTASPVQIAVPKPSPLDSCLSVTGGLRWDSLGVWYIHKGWDWVVLMKT